MHTDITHLAIDHPGANDSAYRLRRDEIARAAIQFHKTGGEIPYIGYSSEEQTTWRNVVGTLDSLHAIYARDIYLDAKNILQFSPEILPELRDVSKKLQYESGFQLHPVEGLIESRGFLSTLAQRIMLCTQYIRHASRPEYTPEPDIIHELIGHAPTFLDPDIVKISECIGRAALYATPEQLIQLERIYWYTIEFGLVSENGKIKALGAGILSSIAECERAFATEIIREPFTIQTVIQTPYDFSAVQPKYFVCSGIKNLRKEIELFASLL